MTDPHRDVLAAVARLNRHMQQLGVGYAVTDATAQLQTEILRHFLMMATVAMDDEGIDHATAERVIDRLIYGCVPNPVQSAERERLIRQVTEVAAARTVRLFAEEKV